MRVTKLGCLPRNSARGRQYVIDRRILRRSPIVSNELINPTGTNGCDNTIPNENASTSTERVDPIECRKMCLLHPVLYQLMIQSALNKLKWKDIR